MTDDPKMQRRGAIQLLATLTASLPSMVARARESGPPSHLDGSVDSYGRERERDSNVAEVDDLRSKARWHLKHASVAGDLPFIEFMALSSMLLDREVLECGRSLLLPESFHVEANRAVATAIYALVDEGVPVDVVSVARWLRDRDLIVGVGGTAYVGNLVEKAPFTRDEGHGAIGVLYLRTTQAPQDQADGERSS